MQHAFIQCDIQHAHVLARANAHTRTHTRTHTHTHTHKMWQIGFVCVDQQTTCAVRKMHGHQHMHLLRLRSERLPLSTGTARDQVSSLSNTRAVVLYITSYNGDCTEIRLNMNHTATVYIYR